jgi:hypothetical protein
VSISARCTSPQRGPARSTDETSALIAEEQRLYRVASPKVQEVISRMHKICYFSVMLPYSDIRGSVPLGGLDQPLASTDRSTIDGPVPQELNYLQMQTPGRPSRS